MKSVIAIASLCIFLVSCGGGAGYNTSSALQKTQLAYDKREACNKPGAAMHPSYWNEVIVQSDADPLYYQKHTSERLIEDDYRAYLIAVLPLFKSCNLAFLQDISKISAYHIPVMLNNNNKYNFLMMEVMQGKVKTFGEYNRRYAKLNEETAIEWARANIDYDNQHQQELAASRAQALQRLQVFNALQQRQQQISTDWINRMSPAQNNGLVYPTTTTCRYVGTSLNCETGQMGSLNKSTTSCRRVGSNIVCDHN